MYIVKYNDEPIGTIELITSKPIHLLSIVGVLNKQKIKFHVFETSIQLTPAAFGWSDIEYWKGRGESITTGY